METLSTLPWATRPTAQAVLRALQDAGIAARFVGGCVRDALLGVAAKPDLDMATPAVPDAVAVALQAAGLKAVPTGIAFGTITAVGPDHDTVEITTLREDIETDGRHAVVKFGTDWVADAARRDFTINALYADPDGTLYDYCDGVADARAQRVRFIGHAATRIAEDYLRILRFFRFTARFGDPAAPDAEGLAAIAGSLDGLKRLARERIWMELTKILLLSRPEQAMRPMADAGVLQRLLPGTVCNFPALTRMADYEHDNYVTPVAVLRLHALANGPVEGLQAHFGLSNREADWLRVAGASLAAGNLRQLRQVWYALTDIIESRRDWLQNVALRLLAEDDVQQTGKWPTELFALASAWRAPVFPLAGADVLALGVAAGPQVGRALDDVEAWWIEKDFKPSRDECLAELGRRVAG